MDDAITLLTKENRRLNTIINALAEKLQATEDLLYAYQKEKACIPNISNATIQNNIGTPNINNATIQNNMDTPNISNAMLQKNVGIPNDSNATFQNNIHTPNISNDMLENNMGIPNDFNDTIREKVGIGTINIPMLMNELKVVMKTCPEPSLLNTAKLLVHVYKNPKNSISDFRKVCSLSADGMAKNIRAMARRHLITKISFQRYVLTEMAFKMLERSSSLALSSY